MVSSFSVWRSFSCSSSSQTGLHQLGALFQVLFLALQGGGALVQLFFLLVNAALLAGDLGAAVLDLLVGFGFQLEGFVFGLDDGLFAFLLGGFDGVVDDALGFLLGRADLGLGSALAVLPAQIKAERRSGNGNNYHHHQYDDGYHVIVTPRRSYFVNHEDRCPRALFQVVSLCQTSFYKTGTATPKSRTPPAKLHGRTAGALPPVVRAADAGGRQNGRQRPETLTKQCCGGWPACGPMPRQILSESGAPGAGGPLYTDFIVSVQPPIVKKLLQSVQAGLATHRPAEYDKSCKM